MGAKPASMRACDELERSIARLGLHDHVCVIYDTQEEQLRSMVPFVRMGIEGGDRCFYVADTGTVEAVVAAMRRGGVDVDGAVRAGKLTVATQREAYLAGGRFDPDAMLDLASGAALQAVADGFGGLRIAGEMTWALGGDPGCERLLEYEVKVNRRIPGEPALAVCQYDRSRFSPDLIRDIIRTHPLVVVGGRVCRNFYYVPPEELLGPDRTRHEVDRLLENILERERAEDALRESERRLSLVLEGSQHAFWDWDLESGVLTFSPLWARWLGHPPEERRGTIEEWKAAIHPDDLAEFWAAVEANLRGETEMYRAEYRVLGAGEPRWISARGRVVARDDAGRPLRMAGTSADVTERRSLQTRLEMAGRLASVGTLAAGVAHEINNPLAFASANLAFLAERLAGDPARLAEEVAELREAAAEAIDGAERVRDIVKGLRRFAVPGGEERRAPVDVRAEIEAAVGITRAQVTARARLQVDLPAGLPAVVAGQHQIGQVLVNLLVNAAQAIPEGRSAENLVRVAASARDGRVAIEVADTGAGIPPQLLPRIFDPFFTTKETGVGSGLGLAICHGIVSGAGGTIEVSSEPGRGTTFRVLLPAVAGRAREAAPPPPLFPAHRRVLVVDDEPLVARAIGRILSSEHEVDIATSGETAAARLEAGERWDVVLCDLLMPGMTGMDLADRLARTAPEVVPRLVFMTGGAFTERSRAFLGTCERRHLEKPVDAAVLRRVVQEVASGR